MKRVMKAVVALVGEVTHSFGIQFWLQCTHLISNSANFPESCTTL